MITILRIVTILLTGFVAMTAIGGGIAMLLGIDKFPAEWIQGTPFQDYTIPALLLAVAVGGSALNAFLMNSLKRRLRGASTAISGFMLSGYITGEVLILKQNPPGPTGIEIFYFLLGVIQINLGVIVHRYIRRNA